MEQQQKAKEKPTGGPGGRVQPAEQHPRVCSRKKNQRAWGGNEGINKINPKENNEDKNSTIKANLENFWSACQPGEKISSVCQFELKCEVAISQTRGDYSDIKMTKTRRQAGDSCAAHALRKKTQSANELKLFT